MQIDEKARRRPDWRGGSPIVLADNQPWWFPALSGRAVPHVDEETGRVEMRPDVGPAYGLLRLLHTAERIGPEELTLGPLWGVARYLLGLNYRLTDDEVHGLIPIDPTRPGIELGMSHAACETSAFVMLALRRHVRPALAVVRRIPFGAEDSETGEWADLGFH